MIAVSFKGIDKMLEVDIQLNSCVQPPGCIVNDLEADGCDGFLVGNRTALGVVGFEVFFCLDRCEVLG